MSLTGKINEVLQRIAEDIKVIQPLPTLIPQSGRFYCYTNQRWITDSDDNYGQNYYQMAENGGEAADPLFEWEHMGMWLPAGRKVSRLFFSARSNSNEMTDFEIVVVARKPNPITRYATGFDNDNEMTNTVIFRDLYKNSTTVPPQVTAALITDKTLNVIELGDWVDEDDHVQLSIYIRPIGVNLVSTRYFLCNWLWEIK